MGGRDQTVVFRVDAATNFGSGHVMRCLSLAEAFVNKGISASFICKNHDGNLIALIESRGFPVFTLNCSMDAGRFDQENYESWVAGSWLDDAELTQSILDRLNVYALVVDHYGLGVNWETVFADKYRLIVIDDLANREHNCSVLIDQTFGRTNHDYQFLSGDAQQLLGPKYSMLRKEFLEFRNASLDQKNRTDLPTRLFVCFGGVDKDDHTRRLLDALNGCKLPSDTTVDVVVGSGYPHLDRLKRSICHLKLKVEVYVGVSNIAEIMAKCHWAIGSSGGVSWERSTLGLPAIVVVLADNQLDVSNGLVSAGAIGVLESKHYAVKDLQAEIDKLFTDYRFRVDINSMISDGKGIERIVDTLFSSPIFDGTLVLRDAEPIDCKALYDWQCEPSVRQYAISSSIPSWREHAAWFKSKLNDDYSLIRIISVDQVDVGVIRLDRTETDRTRVLSISLSTANQGHGYGYRALIELRHQESSFDILAVVLPENIASQKMFQKAGFKRKNETEWLSFSLEE